MIRLLVTALLRWRIESAFNRLKDFRRIATRRQRDVGSNVQNGSSDVSLALTTGRPPNGAPYLCRGEFLKSAAIGCAENFVSVAITP
jgi:hypothetical protein